MIFGASPEMKIMRSNLSITTLTMSLGFLLVQLDVSIVNVALASIANDVHTGVTGLQWIVDSYALAFASLLLSAGALGDRVGACRTFVGGMALFLLGSLGCGLAPDTAALIAARVVQGIGASALVPCSLALLNHAARGDTTVRARAVSLWTAAGSIGLALGPLLGGVLVTAFGWRSIFFVNLPIAAGGMILAYRFVDEAPVHPGGGDGVGQVLATVSLFGLAAAVIEAGPLGWTSPLVCAASALAAVGFGAFIATEHASGNPMLPLRFFRHPAFAAATLVGFVLNLAVYGALFVLALYFRQTHHLSALLTGVALLPLAVAVFAANIAAGWLAARLSPRVIMAGGLLIGSAGAWLLRNIGATTPYDAILPGLVLLPFGIGLAVPIMTTVVLGTVPRSRAGIASGVLNSVRQAGGAIGVALFGALITSGGSGLAEAFTVSAGLLTSGAAIAAGFIRKDRMAMLDVAMRRVGGRG
jgi:MFS transporter, DHA2 family, methylenomycin A resistance protein